MFQHSTINHQKEVIPISDDEEETRRHNNNYQQQRYYFPTQQETNPMHSYYYNSTFHPFPSNQNSNNNTSSLEDKFLSISGKIMLSGQQQHVPTISTTNNNNTTSLNQQHLENNNNSPIHQKSYSYSSATASVLNNNNNTTTTSTAANNYNENSYNVVVGNNTFGTNSSTYYSSSPLVANGVIGNNNNNNATTNTSLLNSHGSQKQNLSFYHSTTMNGNNSSSTSLPINRSFEAMRMRLQREKENIGTFNPTATITTNNNNTVTTQQQQRNGLISPSENVVAYETAIPNKTNNYLQQQHLINNNNNGYNSSNNSYFQHTGNSNLNHLHYNNNSIQNLYYPHDSSSLITSPTATTTTIPNNNSIPSSSFSMLHNSYEHPTTNKSSYLYGSSVNVGIMSPSEMVRSENHFSTPTKGHSKMMSGHNNTSGDNHHPTRTKMSSSSTGKNSANTQKQKRKKGAMALQNKNEKELTNNSAHGMISPPRIHNTRSHQAQQVNNVNGNIATTRNVKKKKGNQNTKKRRGSKGIQDSLDASPKFSSKDIISNASNGSLTNGTLNNNSPEISQNSVSGEKFVFSTVNLDLLGTTVDLVSKCTDYLSDTLQRRLSNNSGNSDCNKELEKDIIDLEVFNCVKFNEKTKFERPRLTKKRVSKKFEKLKKELLDKVITVNDKGECLTKENVKRGSGLDVYEIICATRLQKVNDEELEKEGLNGDSSQFWEEAKQQSKLLTGATDNENVIYSYLTSNTKEQMDEEYDDFISSAPTLRYLEPVYQVDNQRLVLDLYHLNKKFITKDLKMIEKNKLTNDDLDQFLNEEETTPVKKKKRKVIPEQNGRKYNTRNSNANNH
ncbi:hypothetical protein ABK040_001561 [Willaertia magna]